MSAFLAKNYGDRIELLTDRAVYLPDGTLMDTREKVYRLENIPAAITGRGFIEHLPEFRRILDMLAQLFGSFDGAMAAFPRMLERLKQQPTPAFEMVIAGISEEDGPVIVYFTTQSYTEGIDPFRLYQMGAEFGAGTVLSPDELSAAGITHEALIDGLAGKGADFMELMRGKRGPNPIDPKAPEVFGIGGGVDHTVISRAGAVTTRLRDWPDMIGQKIAPHVDRVEAA